MAKLELAQPHVKFYKWWPGPGTSVRLSLEPEDYEVGWGEIPGYFEKKYRQLLGLEPDPGGHLKVVYGHRMRDFIYGIQPCMDFVSARMANMFIDAKFTGCQFVRYTAEGLPNGDTEVYRLIISGRCGPVIHAMDEDDKRGLKAIENGSLNYMDINTWDGSDFFHEQPKYGSWFFTKRVAQAIRKHKLDFTTKDYLWTDKVQFDALFER